MFGRVQGARAIGGAVAALLLMAARVSAQEVTVALGGEATTLDPQRATARLTSILTSSIFDSLTFRDAHVKIQPVLAKSFRRLDDRTCPFERREGVKYGIAEAMLRYAAAGRESGRSARRPALTGLLGWRWPPTTTPILAHPRWRAIG